MAIHTIASAIRTDRAIASGGRSVNDRAAAGAPIMRLKISSVPTTGTVIAVASASTSKKAISIPKVLMPRALATSGRTDESMSGRYRTTMAQMQRPARIAVGANSLGLMPSTSPNSSE